MTDLMWVHAQKPATMEGVKSCVGEGWHELLENLITALKLMGWDGSIAQVKEKFGGLRFYAYGLTDAGQWVVHLAENESFNICEDCGKHKTAVALIDGKAVLSGVTTDVVKGNWVKTLCQECREK